MTLQADITRPRLPRVFIESGSSQNKPSTVHSLITLDIDPYTHELKPYCHNHTVYIKVSTIRVTTRVEASLVFDNKSLEFVSEALSGSPAAYLPLSFKLFLQLTFS